MGRVWLRARSGCPLPLPVPVCGVVVRAGIWVLAAPRLSLGGCWGVCVLVRPSRVVSCSSWLGLLCGGAYLCAPPACSLPFLARVHSVGVRAWPGSRLCPALFWLGCRGVFFAFFFRACLCLALWCRLLAVPVPGLEVPVPPSPSFRAGLLALFFLSSVVCVCIFRCPFPRWAAVPGLALPVLAGWSPCASLGVLSSVPSGWGVWPPLVVLAGGLVAVGCSLAPPPPFFFFGGGLPVPPSAFPGLARALARIQCGLPGRCWRLRSAWPCPGPTGRVGYVHVGLGAPYCWVRSWLCRLGGCARRLRVALGEGAGVVGVLSPLRCRFEPSGWSASVVAGRAVAPCVARGAGLWCAGAAPSGVCGRLFWLVLQIRVSRAVLCRSVPRRVVSCCGALHCGALWCSVACCLALCRGRSVEVSLACVVVRNAGRSVAGWWLGDAVRCGWLAGSALWGLGVPLGLVGRVGICGVALPGGLCLGPVPFGGPGP